MIGNTPAFPIMDIHGRGITIDPWKENFLHRFMNGWAAWNSAGIFDNTKKIDEFETIEHVPDQMKRHELWRLEYRRKLYMKNLTDEQIHDRFDDAMVMNTLSSMTNSPFKPTQEQIMDAMRYFTHILMEVNERGIPMQKMNYSLDRTLAAALRLRMPQQVLDWFAELDRSRPNAGINP